MPESSANAGRPVASAAARALISALSANVSPVSGGSSTLVGQRHDACAARRIRPNSLSLCALRVASTSSIGCSARVDAGQAADGLGLRLAELLDAGLGEREQVVERGARERRALGRRLHLDEAAVAGHDDVGVDLGGRVLRVVEVEQRRGRRPSRTRPPRPTAVSGSRSSRPAVEQLRAGEVERDVGAGDRRAARAAVGLEHVAVEVDRALAERLEVDDAADRAADQALDLDGAAVGAALRDVALLAVAGRRGQHPVLGGDPAAALAGHPARDALDAPTPCRSRACRPAAISAEPVAVRTKPGVIATGRSSAGSAAVVAALDRGVGRASCGDAPGRADRGRDVDLADLAERQLEEAGGQRARTRSVSPEQRKR